ncbi:MAG TPA: cytochrome ubiquinol oxidase subunit I, partial [Desulfurivibrionaceae bacterium]|nr:cytochrome ubiquinol oxidase subunit I [Desulfurivibrionaceae bacterium]
EGNWETRGNVPLLLFALPDQEAQANRFEVGIPSLASLILTHHADGVVPGITETPPEEQPPVAIVFWSFRVMVALGVLMIAVALVGNLLRRGGRVYAHRGYLQALRLMTVTPFVAVLAGWIVTETGRAPWLVYGMMTHAEGVTPSLTGGMALFTLIGYAAVYGVVFWAGIYYLTRVVRQGMLPERQDHGEVERPMRPLSAAHATFEDASSQPARS